MSFFCLKGGGASTAKQLVVDHPQDHPAHLINKVDQGLVLGLVIQRVSDCSCVLLVSSFSNSFQYLL